MFFDRQKAFCSGIVSSASFIRFFCNKYIEDVLVVVVV